MCARTTFACSVLVAGWTAWSGAQPQGIYREPYRPSRSIAIAVADPAPPVELQFASLSLNPLGPNPTLTVSARNLGRGAIPAVGITLRLAFRMGDRMQSFRLTPDRRISGREAVPVLLPSTSPGLTIPFVFDEGEPLPALPASSPNTPAALTVERVDDVNGKEVWSNPNTRELLWGRLGLVSSR